MIVQSLTLVALLRGVTCAVVHARGNADGKPVIFPPGGINDMKQGQPTPALFKSNPDDTYRPQITAEPGDIPDNLPPADIMGNITALDNANWRSTWLYGYNECKKRFGPNAKARIDDAYYDQWKMTNIPGTWKDLDWNSAAALEFLAPPANNKKNQDRIQEIYKLSSSFIYRHGSFFPLYIHIRCDDPAKQCSTQCKPKDGTSDQAGDTIAYALQEDPDDKYSMINFCPPFFGMRRLRDAAMDYGKGKTPPLNQNIENYDSKARVMLHELFHLDYFMNSNGINRITDLNVNYWKTDSKGEHYMNERAYGPLRTKMMAKFQEFANPIGKPAGSYVSRNSDNLAWFAVANYIVHRTGTYPHLPIVLKQIDGPPHKEVNTGNIVTWGDDKKPRFNMAVNGNIAINEDGIPKSPSCSDDLSGSAVDAVLGLLPLFNTFNDHTLNISGMADDSAYPKEYIANLKTWTHDTFGVNYVGDDEPTKTDPQPSPTCLGNQVEGSCKGATLPSAAPFSGIQGPSCAKADGSKGSGPRLSKQAAADAVSQYCENLVNDKVVLSDSTGSPKPGTVAGKAENGADMALYAIYDVSSCPQDKSNKTLDFGTMGQQACYDFLYTSITQVCAQDPTWGDYNKDYTIEGGVFGASCGLFGLVGQGGGH